MTLDDMKHLRILLDSSISYIEAGMPMVDLKHKDPDLEGYLVLGNKFCISILNPKWLELGPDKNVNFIWNSSFTQTGHDKFLK